MKVFISWSGENSASQKFAEGFADWLQTILPAVKPFYSTDDIKKGQAWFEKIAQELDASDFGILSLTPANAMSPWIAFEAGAIAKKVGRGKVAPVLLGMQFADLKAPLAMFNGVVPNHDDVLRLVETINAELGPQGIGSSRVERVFDKWWPDLEKVIETSLRALNRAPEARAVPQKRDQDDLLREILELVRSLSHSKAEREFQDLEARHRQAFHSTTRASRQPPSFEYKLGKGISVDMVNQVISTTFPDGAYASLRPDSNQRIEVFVPAEAGPAESWRLLLDLGLQKVRS
jgi:hypothetical protein